MAIEKVRAYFKNFGKDGDVQEFTVSSATVELAALALGVDGARIAKSMSFYPKEGEGCIIVVTAGDKKVDNGKFKRQFAMKAKMLQGGDVETLTGYAPGGVCPYLRAVDSMFQGFPAAKLTPNQEKRCRNGNAFSIKLPEGTYRVYSGSGEFLMLARVESGVMSTIKSFFDV